MASVVVQVERDMRGDVSVPSTVVLNELPDRVGSGRLEAVNLLASSGTRRAAARDGRSGVVNGMTVGDLVEILQSVPQSFPVVLQMFDWPADQVVAEPVEHVTVCAEEVLLS